MREPHHGFFWYEPSTDPCGAIGANRIWCHFPGLLAFCVPSYVPLIPVGWVRPPLVTIGCISYVVVVIAPDVGHSGDSLLVLSSHVSVVGSDRGVVDGRSR